MLGGSRRCPNVRDVRVGAPTGWLVCEVSVIELIGGLES
jgi:hypothetical protein